MDIMVGIRYEISSLAARIYGKDARIGIYNTSQQERGPANVKNTRKKLIVVGPALKFLGYSVGRYIRIRTKGGI